MNILSIITGLFLLFSVPSGSDRIRVVDYNSLEPILELRNDTTYVVNFWATWCIPCVKELPAFERLNNEYSGRKVKVLLVSLDFPTQVGSRLIPFIEENKIESEVILLDDPNSNVWIGKVDTEWTGSIPATVIFNRDFYGFYERTFEYDDLEEIVKNNLIN